MCRHRAFATLAKKKKKKPFCHRTKMNHRQLSKFISTTKNAQGKADNKIILFFFYLQMKLPAGSSNLLYLDKKKVFAKCQGPCADF
jgi:hypothetical protein